MAINRKLSRSKPISFNKNVAVDRQLDDIRRVVAQLWDEKNSMFADIESLLNNADLDVSTKRILELLANKYGHSSEMPDKKGGNKDHDNRYYPKLESMYQFRRLQPLITKDGQAIVAANKKNVIVNTGTGMS